MFEKKKSRKNSRNFFRCGSRLSLALRRNKSKWFENFQEFLKMLKVAKTDLNHMVYFFNVVQVCNSVPRRKNLNYLLPFKEMKNWKKSQQTCIIWSLFFYLVYTCHYRKLQTSLKPKRIKYIRVEFTLKKV